MQRATGKSIPKQEYLAQVQVECPRIWDIFIDFHQDIWSSATEEVLGRRIGFMKMTIHPHVLTVFPVADASSVDSVEDFQVNHVSPTSSH